MSRRYFALWNAMVFTVLLESVGANARPMLIHESQRIDQPGTHYLYFANSVAMDGDTALVGSIDYVVGQTWPMGKYVMVYRYDGVRWVYDRTLLSHSAPESEGASLTLAMANGLAAINLNPLYVYKHSGSTWTQIAHPFTAPPYSADFVAGPMVWSGGTLLAARPQCVNPNYDWGALTATYNGSTWSTPQRLSPATSQPCTEEPVRYGLSGDTAVISTYTYDFEQAPDTVHVFSRAGGSWTESWTLPGGDGEATVLGNEVFVPTAGPRGTIVYGTNGSDTGDQLRPLNAANDQSGRAYLISSNGDIVIQSNGDNYDRWTGLNVFKKNASGKYQHVAILQLSTFDSLDGPLAISGRRILIPGTIGRSGSNPGMFAFELPATYTSSLSASFGFEGGSAGAWTPTAGTFAVATSGTNHVYRQSSLTGDAISVLSSYDWTDQSIEADITPTAFSGSDRWAGLAVRYLDNNNHYYVSLRNSGVIDLRRKVNGVVTTLMSASRTVTPGSHHHVALKALGQQIKVFVDGEMVLWTYDAALTHGRAALRGYRSQVDYDNVVVNQIGQTTIYNAFRSLHSSVLQYDPLWKLNGTGNWTLPATGVIRQDSLAGDARAAVGVPTGDQVIQARARATAFAAPEGSQERWFGIAARYRDSRNFYYLSLRSGNTVSLRRLHNGVITVLASAPLTVTPGSWVNLRLDAIGNELRGFVNGVQVVQATDGIHAEGQGGLLTFKAAAEWQNYLSWQP